MEQHFAPQVLVIMDQKALTTCCHRLLHNTTTIEGGNDIIVITFFATKPSKKTMTIAIAFFWSKAI
jgi:hypothetical protein